MWTLMQQRSEGWLINGAAAGSSDPALIARRRLLPQPAISHACSQRLSIYPPGPDVWQSEARAAMAVIVGHNCFAHYIWVWKYKVTPWPAISCKKHQRTAPAQQEAENAKQTNGRWWEAEVWEEEKCPTAERNNTSTNATDIDRNDNCYCVIFLLLRQQQNKMRNQTKSEKIFNFVLLKFSALEITNKEKYKMRTKKDTQLQKYKLSYKIFGKQWLLHFF